MKFYTRTLLLLPVLMLYLTTAEAQDHQDWKFTHPRPQANNLRKVKMLDETQWVAVGANGTFMKTVDGGFNWYFHHQAGRYQNAAQMIGQNWDVWFKDPTNGFITGEFGYIGRTTNGGVTFDSVGIGVIPTTQRGMGIFFADQNTGFVAAGASSGSAGTIARTTDGGFTWSAVHTAAESFYSVYAVNSQLIFAAGFIGNIYRSTDGGNTWTSTQATVGNGTYGISFLDANTGFACGGTGFVSKTTDGGNTWAAVNTPQTSWSLFQIKIVSATEIYAVGAPDFLYKTTDLGATWTGLPIMPVSGPSNTFIWYSVDKSGSTLTLSGDYGVVARSTDGGLSWRSESVIYNTNILFDFDHIPGTHRIWASGRQVGTSGLRQLYYSSNMGDTWTMQDVGINFNASSIDMLTTDIGYVSGTNSTVAKTTDGGQTWTQLARPHASNYDLYNLDFINENLGWAFVNFTSVTGGNIFKTTDGGNSWTQQTLGVSGSIYMGDMLDSLNGFASINSTSRPIYKTTDGGATWTAITTPLTGIIRDFKAFDVNNIVVSASSGTVRMAKTTNGGATWTNITLPITVDINSIAFRDMDNGFVIGNSTTVVCRTSDGGTTWEFTNLRLPTLGKVFATNSGYAYVGGTYGSILRLVETPVPVEFGSFTSTIRGNDVVLNWQTATETNNQGFAVERRVNGGEFTEISFVSGRGSSVTTTEYTFADPFLAAGRYEYRLKQIDFDGTTRYYTLESGVVIGVPVEFTLDQNFPNPFNPSTVIRYALPIAGNVTITVYNSLGEAVKTLVNSSKEAGYHEVSFNASDLPSGLYLYELKAGSFSSVKKMLLMK